MAACIVGVWVGGAVVTAALGASVGGGVFGPSVGLIEVVGTLALGESVGGADFGGNVGLIVGTVAAGAIVRASF